MSEIQVVHTVKDPLALRGMPGTREWVAAYMEDCLFPRLRQLRDAGQAEYAGGPGAFGNFERLGKKLDLHPMKVLWVYTTKHLDGIESYLRGHESQREDVLGRIEDVMVYLALFHAWRKLQQLGLQQDQKLDGPDLGTIEIFLRDLAHVTDPTLPAWLVDGARRMAQALKERTT